MSFRGKLGGYIMKKPLPEWLEKENIPSLLPDRAVRQPAAQPAKPNIAPEPTAARRQPVYEPPASTVTQTLSGDTVPIPTKDAKNAAPNRLDARTFVDIAKSEHISGGEFLELLGNSRLSNSAYREIELNPLITLERIVEILDASPLGHDDYAKLIAAVSTIVKNRRKAERRAEREAVVVGNTVALADIQKEYGGEPKKIKRSTSEAAKAQTAAGTAEKAEKTPAELSSAEKTDIIPAEIPQKNDKFSPEPAVQAETAVPETPKKPKTSEPMVISDFASFVGETSEISLDEAPAPDIDSISEQLTEIPAPVLTDDEKPTDAISEEIEEIAETADGNADSTEDEPELGYSFDFNPDFEEETDVPDEEMLSGSFPDTENTPAEPDEIPGPEAENGYSDGEVPDLSRELDLHKDEPAPIKIGVHHAPKSALQKSLESIIAEKKASEIHGAYAATNEPEESDMSETSDFDLDFNIDAGPDKVSEKPAAEELISADDDFFGDKISAPKPLSVTTILSDMPKGGKGFAPDGKPDASVTTILTGLDEAEKEAAENGAKKSEKPESKGVKMKNLIDLPEPDDEPDAPKNKDGESSGEEKSGKRERYKGAEFFADPDENKGGAGKVVLIILLIIVLLVGGGAAASYFMTGSFVPPFLTEMLGGQPAAPEKTAIDSYEKLSEAISQLPAAKVLPAAEEYYTEPTKYTPCLGAVASVGKNVYYIDGTAVVGFEVSEGKSELVKRNEYNCSEIIGIASLNDAQLCVVYKPETAQQTVVAVYGADFSAPLYTYVQDGSFSDIAYINERLCLSTVFTPEQGAAGENAAPSYSVDGNITRIPCEDIYLPLDPVSRSFEVVGTVSEAPIVFAVCGAETSFVTFGGSGILVISDYPNIAAVQKYDISENTASFVSETLVNGFIGSAEYADERNGMLRLVYSTGGGAVINLYDSSMKLLAKAENIAPDEEIKGVSFNSSAVTVFTDGVMRCFSTENNSVVPLDAPAYTPYTNKLVGFAGGLAGIEVTADEKGVPSGLKLSLYSYENKLTPLAEEIISFTAASGFNCNEYINSDAVNNPLAICINEDMKTLVIPVGYFDGVSVVEKFIIYKYNSAEGFIKSGEYTLYDETSAQRDCIICGGGLYIIIDNTVVGISVDNGTVLSTTDMK